MNTMLELSRRIEALDDQIVMNKQAQIIKQRDTRDRLTNAASTIVRSISLLAKKIGSDRDAFDARSLADALQVRRSFST